MNFFRSLSNKLNLSAETRTVSENTGWLFLERGVRMVLGLAIVILMARALGPVKFGLFNYVYAMVMLFSELASMGLNAILVKDMIQEPEKKGEILGTAWFLRLLGSLLACVSSIVLITALRPHQEGVAVLVAIMAGGLLFRSLEVIDFFFQSKVRSKYVVLAKINAYAVTSIAIVLLVWWDSPLFGFVAARAAEFFLIAAYLVFFYCRQGGRLRDWRLSRRRAGGMLRRSWPLIFSGLSAAVYLKVDQIMLGEMRGEAEVGIYAVAAQLSEIWYFIPVAIVSSLFPGLIRSRQEDRAEYHRKLQTLYDSLVGLSLTIAVLIAVFADEVINLLYGEAYAGAGVILAIHIWAGLFIFMRAAFSKWLILENLYIFSLVTHLGGALVNVGANLLLIPVYGGVGAAVATVASYAMAGYFSLFLHPKTRSASWMMTRALGFPFRLLVGKSREAGKS